MELLAAAEMREADRYCIEDLGIPGPVLMENAGLRCVELLELKLGPANGKRVVVCAGKGNNGGDGFVLARHLLLTGAHVRVFLTANADEITGDARLNLDALFAMDSEPELVTKRSQRRRLSSALDEADVAVDALLGTGISGAPRDPAASAIRALNRADCAVLAVDLPSGVNADTGEVAGEAVDADWTVTFARPKTGLLLHPAAAHCGELCVGALGVPESAITRLGARTSVLTPQAIIDALPTARDANTHKGDYGRVFVVGGSQGMSGAVVLACRAALRSGAGLVTGVVPGALNTAVESALIEATSSAVGGMDRAAFRLADLPDVGSAVANADAVAVGPGLSRHEEAAEFAVRLLAQTAKPAVVDADGLTAFSGRTKDLRRRPAPTVLTPHPGEAAAMLGCSVADVQGDRRQAVGQLADETQCVVLLKGSRTLVASPDGALRINPTGNPGMATGGSGDVLTGVIAALLAQRVAPLPAACAGAYLHGLAGDFALRDMGATGLVAGDLVDHLPEAMHSLPEVECAAQVTARLRRIT